MSQLEGDDTRFEISLNGDYVEVLNSAVIPFSVALAAAKEFMICRRPCPNWCNGLSFEK